MRSIFLTAIWTMLGSDIRVPDARLVPEVVILRNPTS